MSRKNRKLRREALAAQKLPTPKELTTEVAQPSATKVTALSPVRKSVATWLSPERLGSLLLNADRGDVESYLTLASELEEREPQIATVLQARKLAVVGLPVVVEAASDDAHDVAIAEHVEQLVAKPEFEGLLLDCLDGLMKGFSAIEIIWSRTGNTWEPTRYEYRDQRHFVFDRDTLSAPRLRSLESPLDGIELQPGKFVVHVPKLRSGLPLHTGLVRPLAVLYALKRFTLQQMMVFLETMGVPVRLGKYPSHMVDKKKELLAAVRAIGSDTAAVVPMEMTVEYIESKNASGNSDVFLATAGYCDAMIAKVVLGQSLTTEASGTGGTGSLALGKVHGDGKTEIRNADARQVGATIVRDLVQVFVDLNYGPQRQYPKVRLDTSEAEDRKALVDIAKTFVELGGEVEMTSLRDRLGFPEPAPGAVLLRAPTPAASLIGGAPGQGDEEDDEPAPEKQLNRARFSTMRAKDADLVDELVEEALHDHWREMLDPVVGQALREVQSAETFEQAKSILAKLENDKGDILDVGSLTRSLARYTFRMRGVGDVTDEPNG